MVNVNRIKFDGNSVQVLSPLENEAIGILWRNPKGMRVRQLYNLLRKKRKVALTSVAVILDRLHEKKLVSRRIEYGRGGSHYIYCSRCSKQDFEESVVDKTVNRLISKFGPVAVSYFNERFAKKR